MINTFESEKGDKTKAVVLHFSRRDHDGIKDMEISVLEFINKALRRRPLLGTWLKSDRYIFLDALPPMDSTFSTAMLQTLVHP